MLRLERGAERKEAGEEQTAEALKKRNLLEMGVGQEFAAPEEPQQNGVAERMMRTLKEMTRCLLLQSGLSGRFWGYTVQMAALIRNNAPTSANPGHQPPNQLFGCEADVTVVEQHPFGCYAVLHREKGKETDGMTGWMVSGRARSRGSLEG